MIQDLEGLQIADLETARALDFVRKSRIGFHLTGSRFFETHNPNSDYDFFCQESKVIEKALTKQGFISLNGAAKVYSDINTAKVYGLGKVDIQLVKDVNRKCAIQDILKASPRFMEKVFNKSKLDNAESWDVLFYISMIES